MKRHHSGWESKQAPDPALVRRITAKISFRGQATVAKGPNHKALPLNIMCDIDSEHDNPPFREPGGALGSSSIGAARRS